MHARYAVAFGRGAHRHALRERASAAGLAIHADWPGMLLLADERTAVITGGQSAVIGQMFTEGGERLQSLGGTIAEPQQVLNCWGNFVFFSGGEDAAACAYRDPSGSIPVYHLSGTGGGLFVPDADVAAALGLIEGFAADPGFAVHWLQFPYLRSSRSGVENVRELLPGTVCRKANGQWIDTPLWQPWDHARGNDQWRDFDDAVEALRSVALCAVAKQLSAAPVLLQLSGGLDSSIIAACLHHAEIPFSAVTFATRSADGDERRHARTVAGAFGAVLSEITEDELQCSLPPPPGRTFRPGSNPVLLPLDRAIEKHRREIGGALLVDGGGGDNLFCYLTSAAPVLDALRAAGPRTALAAARDVAERAECNLWQVAGGALRRARPARRRWKEDRRFLNGEALLPGPDSHPWLGAPCFSLPGKRDHVASLVQIQHFLDRRLTAGTAALHPLMAKPLLELCLAIPTWLWIRGGIDRSAAREAFRQLLPASILERRSKGSLQGLFHRFFDRLCGELKDLLLSGELRELRILDAVAVEQAFAAENWTQEEVQMRLSEMATLELWLQSWAR